MLGRCSFVVRSACVRTTSLVGNAAARPRPHCRVFPVPNLYTRPFSSSPATGPSSESLPKSPAGGQYYLQFKCSKCHARTSGLISKLAYEKGVVIMRCSGCQVNHLVADHLGWINEKKGWTIEDIEGDNKVTRISLADDGVLNLVPKQGAGDGDK